MKDLIANTGIQYLTSHINMDDLTSLSTMFYSEKLILDDAGLPKEQEYVHVYAYRGEDDEVFIDKSSINAEALGEDQHINDSLINLEAVTKIPEDELYAARIDKALKAYQDIWIPIPYYASHSHGNSFRGGPTDWARMFIHEILETDDVSEDVKNNYTHTVVIAFDTKTKENQEKYRSPQTDDATSVGNSRFKVVDDASQYVGLYKEDWFVAHLLKPFKEVSQGFEASKFAYLGHYILLLNALNKGQCFPEIALLSAEKEINTTLVLDIGNSRTCGLLVQTSSPDQSELDMTKVSCLQIRDMTRPYKVYDRAFPMEVVFAEENFGESGPVLLREDYIYENTKPIFKWPSLVRVGEEAKYLSSMFERQNAVTSMSSPKRFLWDKEESRQPWIKINKSGDNTHRPALFGISKYLKNNGSYDRDYPLGATDSKFSRNSIMCFTLYEIIMQALSQINQFEFRLNQGNSHYKRVLKDLVLTCPTAMTDQEKTLLKKAAKDAVELIRRDFENIGLSDSLEIHPPAPRKWEVMEEAQNPIWQFDEATCTQLVFLYGELADKFKGQHKLFFKYKGKRRSGLTFGDEASVNIASVDIGGGTTDLMICNYQPDPKVNIPSLTPTPLFWEGFNIAGDDIVKRLVEFILIPQIADALRKKGGNNIEGTMAYMFGPDLGAQSATHRIKRRQFVNQIGNAFAHFVLALAHSDDFEAQYIKLGDVFDQEVKPENDLIPYLNKEIGKQAGMPNDTFDLLDIDLHLVPYKIEHSIRDIMGPVVDRLSKLIAQFDCDLLLLCGRPSRLSVIQKMFVEAMAVSPNQIVNLGGYRIGTWYPFATNTGVIKDPKTTVCVGALVGHLSKVNKLPLIKFDLAKFDVVRSTAKYLGVIKDESNPRIADRDMIFDNELQEGSFQFHNEPVSIGMKQIIREDWIATQIYVFDYKNDEIRQSTSNPLPFTVEVFRDASRSDVIDSRNIRVKDANGEEVGNGMSFKLKFQTISRKGHWRETGNLLVDTVGEYSVI